MEWLREYLLSVLTAGIICGICAALPNKKQSSGKIIRMLCGLFLTVTFIAPLVKIKLDTLSDYWDDTSEQANAIITAASDEVMDELCSVIAEEVKSYIINKAGEMDLQLDVFVKVGSGDPPVLQDIEIRGAVSPYQKKMLSQYIEQELGVPGEKQIWN